MYFTTKTNTGVYLCALCTLNTLSSRCKKEFSMERGQAKTKQGYPGPLPNNYFHFFLVKQKPFFHNPLVMAHDLAACLSVFPNKPNKIQDITTNKQKYRQTTIYALSCGEKLSPKVHLWRKNDKYQVWIQGVVARDIVFRFPNIKKNTKEGKALLFVRLLSFLSNYSNSNYTLKQTKNNT